MIWPNDAPNVFLHKKMRSILSLVAICLCTTLSAQYSMASHKSGYFKKYLNGRLVVQLTGDDGFDQELRNAVSTAWPGKTVEFMESTEVRGLGTNCDCAVLGPFGISIEGIDLSGYGLYIPGHDINATRLSNMLAFVPITCTSGGRGDDDKFRTECDIVMNVRFKIHQIVSELAAVANYVQEHKYKPTLAHFGGVKKFEKRYNYHHQKERIDILAKKTLLIDRSDLSKGMDENSISRRYKYKFKIVEHEEFTRLVSERTPGYLAVLVTYSPLAQLSVIDLETDRMLHVDVNFKNIAMKIDRKLDNDQIGDIDHKRLLKPGTGFKLFLAAIVIYTVVDGIQ